MLNENQELAKIFKTPVFGSALTIATKQFQKRVGLPETGKPSAAMWRLLAKGKKNNVFAINQNESKTENFDDDDIVIVDDKLEEKLPTCASILELYVLFENTNWELVKSSKQGCPYSFSHCTATQPEVAFTTLQNNWRRQGWVNDGYNVCVAANGDWILMVPFDRISNGVKGFNSKSIHKSYVGGVDKSGKAKDTRTPEQILFDKHWHYLISVYCPWMEEKGHNEVAAKACPSYKLKDWLKNNRL